MNCEKVTQQCIKFIQDKVKESGSKGIVLGVSGGIDSSVVAALCIRAVGKDNCKFIYLPGLVDNSRSYVTTLCNSLDFNLHDIINIYDICLAFGKFDKGSKLAKANMQARMRMIIQYFYANEYNLLVAGTTNKTEAMIGYYTKYGDGGVDIEPIADIYKTEVWELGKYLGVPKEIIERAPTAGLWEGQTDEGEIGMTYKELDDILKALNKENNPSGPEMLETTKLTRVANMIEKSEHKRCMPPSPKLEKE